MKGMANKGFDKEIFKKSVVDNVKNLYRRTIDEATPNQVFQAVAYAVKDVIIDEWIATHKEYEKKDVKTVYYLSMEFLMGRALGNNIISIMARQEVREALDELGFDLNVIEDQEPDAALGNGGLGRLAACFLDSLATLGYPAYGCGIRYHYGMFKQKIENGYQVEVPDNWLKDGNPFEVRRSEYATEVKFGGYVRTVWENGREYFVQEGYQSVMAVPYDLPVVGYGNNVVNTLRIWDAQPINTFNLDSFDKGDYQKAVEQENLAKTICDVLYPNDNHYAGKELRLKQQYFFISASVQRAVSKYMEKHDDIRKFYEKNVFQLNDTHPTVAVAELMRILLDDYNLTGKRRGMLLPRPVLTPTTPSWLRHWKNGRSSCSPDCFRVSTRSSRRSTAASSLRSSRNIRATRRRSRRWQSFTTVRSRWLTWPSQAASLSTA